MKTLLSICLFLVAVFFKSSAQTDDISPELRKEMKEADDRLQFIRTNECPIHADIIVWNRETSYQVSYRGHTNMVVYEPIPEQQFDFHLFSIDGKEIPKAIDYKFGRKLEADKSLLAGNYSIMDDVIRGHNRRLDFKKGNYSHFWKFDILKSFRIKEPGEYRLQVEVRLFTKGTNGVFQPFILPSVETHVKILDNNLGRKAPL